MTTYYIDSALSYEAAHANNGTASATPWGGAGGIQRALGLAAAGDTIKVRSGWVVGLSVVKLVAASVNGAFAVDDQVACREPGTPPYNTDAPGEGVGRIVYRSGTTFYVAVTEGTWDSGKVMALASNPATFATSCTMTTPGLVLIGSGTAASPITLAGVGADWSVGSGQVQLGGASAAANCLSGSPSYYNVSGFLCTAATGDGIYLTGSYHRFENCESRSNGISGFRLTTSFAELFRCTAALNSQYGFNNEGLSHMALCRAANNTKSGFVQYGHGALYWGCVASANTERGFYLQSNGVTVAQCVADGNGLHGIYVLTGVGDTFLFNRITHNDQGNSGAYDCGIAAWSADAACREDYNVFYANGNTGDKHLYNVSAGAHSVIAASEAQAGYANRAGGNFATAPLALLRSTAIALANSVAYVPAGLPPVQCGGGSIFGSALIRRIF